MARKVRHVTRGRRQTGYISIIYCLSRQQLFIVLETNMSFGNLWKMTSLNNDEWTELLQYANRANNKTHFLQDKSFVSNIRCSPCWVLPAQTKLSAARKPWKQTFEMLKFAALKSYPFQSRTKKGTNFFLRGTCWPRKLISILAKLDCTLIWMWGAMRRGILPAKACKHPGKAIKLGRLAHKDKCAVIRPDHFSDLSFVWWPWQPQLSQGSFKDHGLLPALTNT